MSIFNYTESIVGIQDIEVEKVKQDDENITIEFHLKKRKCKCPNCSNETDTIHDYRTQEIKDTGIQGKKVNLIWHKRRYKCTCNKQFYEPNNFIAKYKRMSNRKVLGILDKVRTERNYTNVAREEGVSTPTVMRAFDMIQFTHPRVLPEAIGIDEFKGNAGDEKYNCIITDLTTGKPIDILKTRKEVDLLAYFRQFDRSNVKYFVSDMFQAYKEIAKNMFPKAVYVTDKYHWVRQCIWAFEKVRKNVQKKLTKAMRIYFKHARNLLLKHEDDLTSEEKHKVSLMLYYDARLSSAYYLKEELYYIIRKAPLEEKKARLKDWIQEARDKDIPEFEYCANTYCNWFDSIVNSFYSPYTNGPTEGCNNRIKVLKRVSYGVKNFTRFRNRILYIFS